MYPMSSILDSYGIFLFQFPVCFFLLSFPFVSLGCVRYTPALPPDWHPLVMVGYRSDGCSGGRAGSGESIIRLFDGGVPCQLTGLLRHAQRSASPRPRHHTESGRMTTQSCQDGSAMLKLTIKYQAESYFMNWPAQLSARQKILIWANIVWVWQNSLMEKGLVVHDLAYGEIAKGTVFPSHHWLTAK